MDKLISVISTALPVFLALAIGMLCRSKGFLTRDGVDTLKKVVVNLTLPFALFGSFSTAKYTLSSLVVPIVIFVVCCIMLALGFVWVKASKLKSRLAPFLASGFEAGMLGIPLFALLFPGKESEFAILILGQEIFVFTLYKMLLTGKTSLKAIVQDFITSPTLIAVVLGLLVGATGLYDVFRSWGIHVIFEAVTSKLSAPTGIIILFAVGYDLVIREIPWKKTAGLIAMRFVIAGVMLGVLILLNRTLLGGVIFEAALVILFILPSPYVIPIFSDEPSERVQISSALSALTLVTMILFAVCTVVVGLM